MIGDKQITEEMESMIKDALTRASEQRAREIKIGLSTLHKMYCDNFQYIRNDEALHLRYVANYISFWMQARAIIALCGERAFDQVVLPPTEFFLAGGIVAGPGGRVGQHHPESVVFVPTEGVQA